jgi:hypothetical protein
MRLSSVRELVAATASFDPTHPPKRRNKCQINCLVSPSPPLRLPFLPLGSIVAPTVNAAEGGPVHCAGVNSCKGHSDCKTAKSECKGTNACKGQGWVTKASAKECTDAGGKVVK